MNIPPAALEAGAKVLHANLELFEDLPWEDLSDADQDEYREQIRAAFLAMIEAWPGMHLGAPWVIGVPNTTSLILPLPQEITLNAQDISALDVKSTREGISDDE